MRFQRDNTHVHRTSFKGVGRVYVDAPTKRLFKFGFFGWAIAMVPSFILVTNYLPEASSVWLVVAAAGAFLGWIAGMIVGSLTAPNSKNR